MSRNELGRVELAAGRAAIAAPERLGVRWTVGDVSARGWQALRLSLWGAWRLFGPAAGYAVCVNGVSLEEARARVGRLPFEVQWLRATGERIPPAIRGALSADMAEGVGWKFDPVRVFPDRWELSLDNDVVLWRVPNTLRRWLADGSGRCLIGEDVRACFGVFAAAAGARPLNSGLRGYPPGVDIERVLDGIVAERGIRLTSELDEQGLQVVALQRLGAPWCVSLGEVSICSPFPPHLPALGTHGAHFVGTNAHSVPWDFYGRPAVEVLEEHWRRWRRVLQRLVHAPDGKRDERAA